MDVAFVRQMECDPDCETQKSLYPFVEMEEASVALNQRFLFDLDGHAFTKRFHRLLASQSTVLKQTMVKEWHDDSLVPWLHYVPISLEGVDLPEVLRFLGSERGEPIARMIADQGGRGGYRTGVVSVDVGVCAVDLCWQGGWEARGKGVWVVCIRALP